MKKVSEKKESGGKLEILEDLEKHLFLAQPHGFINPTLMEEDLKRARSFSRKCTDHWTYLTNTEDIKLINPLNILYLKEVKKLKNLREIVVYAPGLINRMLIRLITPIFQPDRILKRKKDYVNFLREVS